MTECTISVLFLMVIGIKWPKRVEKVQKRIFLALLWLPDPLVWARKSFKNFKPTPVIWPHALGISIPNLPMFQLTLLNWLPMESGKVWIFRIFVTSSNDFTFFSHFSRTKNFPFLTRHNHAKFGADQKRCTGYPEDYSLTGFKKCPLSKYFFLFRKIRN